MCCGLRLTPNKLLCNINTTTSLDAKEGSSVLTKFLESDIADMTRKRPKPALKIDSTDSNGKGAQSHKLVVL